MSLSPLPSGGGGREESKAGEWNGRRFAVRRCGKESEEESGREGRKGLEEEGLSWRNGGKETKGWR